jgi:hypothetical protein
MINKDFTQSTEALELKGLGFNEPCFKFYIETGELIPASYSKEGTVYPSNSDLLPEWTASPTYSQAFRWFREKHGMVFNLVGSGPYYPSIAFILIDGNSDIELGEYDNYEEAELACLRKMVEIVKAFQE